MTEYSPSDAVGADAIDAYLVSVEHVLLAARAPNSERFQVLQDLESQIADMLAQQVPPLTEEKVQSVIAMLEPASHFATMYGAEAAASPTPAATRAATTPYSSWVLVAASSCALIPLACILLTILAGGRVIGPAVGAVAILLMIGTLLTPFALWKAFQQLRAEPQMYRGRNLAITAMVGYCVTIPLILFGLASAATDGIILFPLAVASFIYFQFVLIRRLRRRMEESLPTEPTSGSFQNPRWQFTQPTQAAPTA